MKRHAAAIVICGVIAALLFLGRLPLITMTSPVGNEFADLIHFRWNAWLPWRLDPLTGAINSIGTSWGYVALLYVIFFGGLASLMKNIPAALVCTLSFLSLWQLDPVVMGAMAWIPWLALCMILLQLTHQPAFLVIILYLALRLAQSAIYLAPVSLIAVMILVWTLSPTKAPKLFLTASLLAIIPIAFVMSSLPFPNPLDYPIQSAVIPFSGVAGTVRPLIGFDSPISSISRIELSSSLLLISAMILVAFLTFTPRKNPASIAGTLLTLVVVLDLNSSAAVAQILPVAALSRVLPGSFLFPIHPILLSVALILLHSILAKRQALWKLPLVSAIIVITLLNIKPPALEFKSDSWWEGVMHSPSSLMARTFGYDYLSQAHAAANANFGSANELVQEITASSNPDNLKNLIDNDSNTRWSAPQTGQGGYAWIFVTFKSPISLKALRIMTGAFRSDFPRGIELRAFSECTAINTSNDQGQLIFHQEDWLGNIGFTPSGLPYLLGQENPIIYIGKPVKCLKLSNIGISSKFDWSISEMQLAQQ